MANDLSFGAIVSAARRDAGLTAAEFDHQLTLGPDMGGWRAYNGLGNAIYAAATASLHADAGMGVRLDRAEALRAHFAEDIDRLIADAKAKSYTGWSTSSRGPIRYAR